MKKFITAIAIIFSVQISFSQVWNTLPFLTGAGRANTATFSIGDTGFFMAGSDAGYLTDCWKYDASAGAWSPRTDFPTSTNSGAVGFAIGNNGYIGTGASSGYTMSNSFWKYYWNTWTPIAPLPGAGRWGAFSFVINGKAYVGGGMSGNNSIQDFDMYQYDPGTDHWTAMTNCPASMGTIFSFAFVIGSKAYVGTGSVLPSFTPQSEFWEYDPNTGVGGTWTKKKDFANGTVALTGATGYATCSEGYAGAGCTNASQNTYDMDIWQYDPGTDNWTVSTTMLGTSRYRISEWTIGKTAYFCGGCYYTGTYFQDLYSITPSANPQYTSTLSGGGSVCAGTSISYSDASNYTPTNWLWTFPGGTPSTSNLQNPTVTYNTPGTYNVTFQAWAVCDSGGTTATNYVNVVTQPSLSITPASQSMCSGKPTTLTVSGATSYQWSDGETSSSITLNLTADSTISVIGKDNTCSADTSIHISVHTVPVVSITPADSTVCAGDPVSLTASGAGPGGSYSWKNGQGLSDAFVANPVATPLTTTTYTLTETSMYGCSDSGKVTITINPNISTTTSRATEIHLGQSTSLVVDAKGNTNYTYSWSPAEGLSCTTCADPLASPTVTTRYSVTTSNSMCSVTDTVTISVAAECGPVYMPNAFSPNGDGVNDVINLMGNCITNMDLTIFDRWGNKVFESNNPHSGWDGMVKGKPANTGTYVYSLEASDYDNNTISQRGNITLLR